MSLLRRILRWPLSDKPPQLDAAETYGRCACCGDTGRLIRRRLCWMCLLTLNSLRGSDMTREERERVERRLTELWR